MRFRDGFSLSEVPELRSLIPDFSDLKTPGLSRRFLFLDDLEDAGEESLAVAFAGTRLSSLASVRAPLVLAEAGAEGFPAGTAVVRVRDGRAAIAALLRALADRIDRQAPFASGPNNSIHPSAVVEGVLEGDVTVEAGAYVAASAFVGRGSRIGANAVIRAHCLLGPRADVQAGAVIGEAGFGFFAGPAKTGGAARAAGASIESMPHLAGVVLGADVFVGANTVIAAGVLHPTTLGDGCKLDSHVQIAHNVTLGPGAMLASQAGIAGSTRVGAGFRMGGAASVAGHLRIGNNVSVAAKAGVTKDVADGETVAGFPARPIAEWRRAQATIARLGRSPDTEA